MYDTLMLVLTNSVQVLLHTIITNVMSCTEILTLPFPFQEPCPQGEGSITVACVVAPE